MSKLLYIVSISLIISNCTFKKVVKQHGVPFLDKKHILLTINKSNTNDIKKILGTPSTRSKFDNDVWIYIERQQTQSKIKNLGKMKLIKNNVLVLEIDNYGVLHSKKLYTISDMANIKRVEETTQSGFEKNSFIYDI